MKLLWILVVGCFAVNALISDEDYSDIYNQNVRYGPRNSDLLLGTDKDIDNFHTESKANISVEFYLYTKANPNNGRRVFANKKSIGESNFNPAYPTRFIIHDYYNNYLTPLIKKIRKTLLKVGEYNVFVVNWPIAFDRLFSNSELAVPSVGQKIAEFIDYMVQNHSMILETTHLIGFGLGAHVSGCVGKNIKNGQINTIIGLNPASSSLNNTDPSNRLNSTDAFYVETIQTEGNIMGVQDPVGKATFYPNGGLSQPSCTHYICSHRRAVDYYAESIIRDNFAAIKCGTYQDAIDKKCGWIYSSVRMGGNNKNTFMVSGIYYVPVREKAPYGIFP